jgi:hypothetical protein
MAAIGSGGVAAAACSVALIARRQSGNVMANAFLGELRRKAREAEDKIRGMAKSKIEEYETQFKDLEGTATTNFQGLEGKAFDFSQTKLAAIADVQRRADQYATAYTRAKRTQ